MQSIFNQIFGIFKNELHSLDMYSSIRTYWSHQIQAIHCNDKLSYFIFIRASFPVNVFIRFERKFVKKATTTTTMWKDMKILQCKCNWHPKKFYAQIRIFMYMYAVYCILVCGMQKACMKCYIVGIQRQNLTNLLENVDTLLQNFDRKFWK